MVAIGEHRDLLDSLDVWRPGRRREREIAEVGHVHRPAAAAELLPTLRQALAADTVSVIACPVDYSANLELIESLGDLDDSLS